MANGQKSYVKEIVAAVVIAVLAGGSAPWWWSALVGDGSQQPSGNGPIDNGPGDGFPCEDPSISLSRGSGPSGTEVVVRGRGFPSDESVEVRFHTEDLPPARTDPEGNFEVNVVIPGTFDAFAPQQFSLGATTKPTICSDTAPFDLTA
jgi:hypothetical protein